MNRNGLTDGELAGAFAESGADELFDELVRRHGSMVFRTCRRVTGSHQDAEDAMQQVFVTLARRAGELAGHASLGGWLYSTAWRV
jgi:DNA-directed RNA polymerase specialized sigma24 family protein